MIKWKKYEDQTLENKLYLVMLGSNIPYVLMYKNGLYDDFGVKVFITHYAEINLPIEEKEGK